VLQAENYQAVFELHSLEVEIHDGWAVSIFGHQTQFGLEILEQARKNYFGLVVQFVLDPQVGQMAMKSIPTTAAAEDLEMLMEYVEQHIHLLERDSTAESYGFLTQEGGFLFRCGPGGVHPDGGGSFSLLLMVNIDRLDQVYVGGECDVGVREIRAFLSSLRETLAEFAAV